MSHYKPLALNIHERSDFSTESLSLIRCDSKQKIETPSASLHVYLSPRNATQRAAVMEKAFTLVRLLSVKAKIHYTSFPAANP